MNPFLANALILYPLKTLENQRFSGVFRGGIKWKHWSEIVYKQLFLISSFPHLVYSLQDALGTSIILTYTILTLKNKEIICQL